MVALKCDVKVFARKSVVGYFSLLNFRFIKRCLSSLNLCEKCLVYVFVLFCSSSWDIVKTFLSFLFYLMFDFQESPSDN